MSLADFNLQLIHLPGKQMVQSDALSRRPDHCPDTDTDNEDRVLLPDNLFVRTIDLDLHDLIASTGKEDNVFQSTIKAIVNQEELPLNFRSSDWTIKDDLLLYKDHCYVLDNLDLR